MKPLPPKLRDLLVGLGFVSPNVCGFLVFTFLPLIFSLIMAFTDWDLRYHNQFKDAEVTFVGFDNFVRLFGDMRFWRYLGNTLFFMMGIPLGMAGSLLAALLLNKPLGTRRHATWVLALAGICFFCAVVFLSMAGAFTAATLILMSGIVGLILFGGMIGGTPLYRTLFYTPHFTAGVATYILWKKLYDPLTGPVNVVLEEPLASLGATVRSLPDSFGLFGLTVFSILAVLLVWWGLRILNRHWHDTDIGTCSLLLGLIIIVFATSLGAFWALPPRLAVILTVLAIVAGVVPLVCNLVSGRRLEPCAGWKGSGFAFFVMLVLSVGALICLGLGNVVYHLPAMADAGLAPPEWLTDYHWAKPALMAMGLWAAIGSNNMILYLAGLSNVPEELEEAALMDGANRWQRFWAVTWPHLAPVTFFIFIMSVIHGLQGGFEMARVMTNGGPAGATTTLSYYIYTEGFETGRLGYASAISWVLFGIVLLITLINWRVGNRYTHD